MERRAFTLIELIVVIAIIVILGSLTFAAGRSALRSSHTATCAANLRQIGNAINTYAADHNMRYPGAGRSTSGHWRRWSILLNDYFFQGKGTISQFKFDPGCLFCPTMGKMPDQFGADKPQLYSRTYGINIMTFVNHDDKTVAAYGYPRIAPPPGYTDMILGEAVMKFPRPSQTVLVGELEFPTDVMQAHANINPIPPEQLRNGYLYRDGRHAYRHNGKMNVLFMDGHVAPRGPDEGMDLRSTFASDPQSGVIRSVQ